MPITVEAAIQCDEDGCTETTTMTLTRDSVSAALVFRKEALPRGWDTISVGSMTNYRCPTHAQAAARRF